MRTASAFIVTLMLGMGMSPVRNAQKPPTRPAAKAPRSEAGEPVKAKYVAYWLTRDPPDPKSKEYEPVLLLTRVPVAELAGYAELFRAAEEKKSGDRPPLLEYIAITVETVQKDSIWNPDGRPLKPVRSVGPSRPAVREVTVNGTKYWYEDCPIRDVVRLLENPEGTDPVHRLHGPLDGAENTARALALLLKGQLTAEEKEAPVRIENGLGFRTLGDAKSFREYWGTLADENKLTGKLSDHLTRDRIASAVALEVNVAVADFLTPTRRSSLDDEFQAFLTAGHRFHTGRLPDDGIKDTRRGKYFVLLLRTKDGGYGLVTFYQGFTPETNWVVVSFHTVPPGELIEERPDPGEPDSFRQKHYLEKTREPQ